MLNSLLVVAIAGGLLPLAASVWWFAELGSHFRLQYLALAAVLLVAALVRRRRRLAAALVAVMAVNAWPLLPYLPAEGRPAAGEPLTILNVNVNARNTDYARIVEGIRSAGADVVTVIELSDALERQLEATEPDYPYRVLLPKVGNFGLGVLSRFPITGAEPFELGFTTALRVEIAHPAGPFRLFAVHPVPPMSARMAARRNAQLAELAGLVRAQDAPVLVCGDFNLSPYSPWFRKFESDAGVTDVRRGLGPGTSWPAAMPLLGIPIDHCFLRGPFAIESVERMDRIGSDHYPVRVSLRRLG